MTAFQRSTKKAVMQSNVLHCPYFVPVIKILGKFLQKSSLKLQL